MIWSLLIQVQSQRKIANEMKENIEILWIMIRFLVKLLEMMKLWPMFDASEAVRSLSV